MPAPEIDLAELRAHLQSARGELERWAAELAAGARAEKAAHDTDTERASGARPAASTPCRQEADVAACLPPFCPCFAQGSTPRWWRASESCRTALKSSQRVRTPANACAAR
jgi:hypothetical protein